MIDLASCRSKETLPLNGLATRVCQAALALYLMPVVALVLALGVVLLALTEMVRLTEGVMVSARAASELGISPWRST
jgi:hypothetical protein